MKESRLEEITICQFEKLSKAGCASHAMSTRKGGLSPAPFGSLNLSFCVGDKNEAVLKNRRIFARAFGADLEKMVFAKQVHGCKVAVVDESDAGRGSLSYENGVDGVDALITDTGNVCLVVLVADCAPVLLFDSVKKVVAAAHAGWKGTKREIAKKTVLKMQTEFSCDPKNIVAGVGPSIGPCCYAMEDKETLKKWQELYSEEEKVLVERKNKAFLDLWQANRIQLLQAGLLDRNIEVAKVCTQCNTDKFYSFRKDGVTGRFAAAIMLRAGVAENNY